jgi:hypothetical protein
MDTTSSTATDWPETIGRFIGICMVTVTVGMISSLILSVAWNAGPAKLLGQPNLTWADSLACLVSIWILSAPLRGIRVKMVD